MTSDEQDPTVPSNSDGPTRDRESSVSERGSDGDPPSLPPFAKDDGPKPQTMYGMPALDVFGSVDGLFDVPTLGAKPPSGPATKSGGPPPLMPKLPPLQGRKGPPPPRTGPHPAIPPVNSIGDPAPPPTAKVKPKTKPIAKPKPANETGVPDNVSAQKPVVTPTHATPLPSAAGLIAKIRAAKLKAEAEAAAAEGASETQDADSASDETTAPEQAVAAAPEPDVAVTPEPEPEPDVTAPEPTVTRTTSEPAEALEPEPAVAATPTASLAASLAESLAESLAAPRDSEDEATLIAPSSSTGGIRLRDAIEHGELSPASSDTSISMDGGARTPPAKSGQSGSRKIAPAPPPTKKSTLAPPPPPTSLDGSEQHQKIGVPYEPPALILKADADAGPDASEPDAELEAETEDHTDLPRPARLPAPGARLAPASPLGPTGPTGAALRTPASLDPSEGAPIHVAQQDTAALIAGLTNEIIANSEHEAAVTLKAKTPKRIAQEDQTLKRRKFALYFLGAAAVLSLIVALLPSRKTKVEEAPREAVTESALDEPTPEQPSDLLAQANPTPGPAPLLAAPGETETGDETDTGGETETGGEVEAEAPEPEPKPEPRRRKSTKSKPEPAPEPKPEPVAKPEPKPQPVAKPSPGGPGDTRDDKQLYTAAKAAYNSGRASEAYKLAYASWRKSNKSKTAELMTLAACKMKDKGKASSSLGKVMLVRRNAMKKDCSAMGVSL